MKLPISKRLLACADLIPPGSRVADVGTDHGYMAIHLLQNHLAAQVLAADIGEQPLQKARDNAEKFGVAEKISFHLSDGLQNVPRDFDVLLIAGLGAATMVHILEEAPWLHDGSYRLILQCQSSQNELRAFLSDHGWTILREILVKDGHFIYTALEAVPGDSPLSPAEQFASPALLREKSPLLVPYLQFCIQAAKNVVAALEAQGGEKYEYYRSAYEGLLEMEENAHDNGTEGSR